MGKKMTKKKRKALAQRRRRYLRTGVLSLLVVLGLVVMGGMAMLNGSAKPRRDMKWYMRDGEAQIAAPALGEGYAASTLLGDASGPALAVRGSITPRPTIKPTMEPRMVTEAPEDEVRAGDSEADAPEAFDELPSLEQGIDVAQEEVASGTVMLKITAAGDCTFGGEMGSKGRRRFVDLANKNGYDYFFDDVRSVFEDDDLTIVNLEGPLTTVEKTNKHGFVFKGAPEYVNILTGSSVELCNLANNHTLDYGKAGLRETVDVLDANGVGYCGYSRIYNTTIRGVRVSSMGFTWWDNNRKEIVQAISDARANCDLLIVNIHWGVEGNTMQDGKQEALGHAMIDAGADLVIGTHPHVYQGIEKYKGRYIVYSLGNFCFAGNANPNDKRCMIFQQTFSFNPGMGIAQANLLDAGINIIPCTVSSVQNMNDFRPTIMQAKEGGAMLRAVASHSSNFSLTSTLWMRNNYLLTSGLVDDGSGEQARQPATADIGPEAGDASADEPSPGVEAAEPEQEAGEMNTL